MQRRLLFSLITLLLIISCYNEEPVISPTGFVVNNWDTVFTIKTLNLPDSSLYHKSIVNVGNTYRLRKFFNSLKTKPIVKIGFIGGSITAGYGASVPSRSYTRRFCTFLKNQFPGNEFVAVNAGISATDSRFGCSRIEDDLLSKKPDMVIIEFAVNDYATDFLKNSLTEEGLVRRCLSETEGPLMYLLLTDKAGQVLNQQVDSTLGSYYGLPVISYQKVCWPELQNGNLLWGDITADIIHPNDNGHLIISYLLYAFIKNCFNNFDQLNDIPPDNSTPLWTSIFENADIYKADNASININNFGWVSMAKEYGRKSFMSSQRGSTLIINCNIHELTLGYSVWAKYNGQLEISINGIAVDTVKNNAGSLPNNYLCQKTVFLDTNSIQPKKITLKTLNGQYFELTYLMFAR
jgi:hypothetical protein